MTDYAELQPIETVFTFKRTAELSVRGVTGNFDLTHPRAIHLQFFQNIFPWAGELRVINPSKRNSTSSG